jgi:hypothetical protein
VSGGPSRGVEEVTAACDEIEAGLRRARELLKDAETYQRHAFCQSFQDLYEDMMLALERAWMGCMTVTEELSE